MKIHRFVGNFNFSSNKLVISEPEIFNQLRNVLRVKIGDSLILADGESNEALVKILKLTKNSVELEIVKISKNESEPDVCGILYCSILKRENFELVIQKATEIGIKKIYPLITQRTIKFGLKEQRLKKIIKEAAEQSGRGIIPVLNKTIDFEEAIKIGGKNDLNLFFDISGDKLKFESTQKAKGNNRGIFIGPEGGWSEEEIKIAKKAGFQIIGLSKLTFRAETAAIVASYLATHS